MDTHVEIPSYVSCEFAKVGFGQSDLSHRSILIDDDGVSYLIGQDALTNSWDSTRIFGGHLEVPQYRNLLRALAAKTLGAGVHEATVALSASHLWIDQIRESARSVYMRPDQEQLLRETLTGIRFKNSITGDWQDCSVAIIERPHVYHELAAVSFVIPRDRYRNYVLWQLGHGDLQQVVFIDGAPMSETILRTEGVSFAVRKLGEILRLHNQALSDSAWISERTQTPGELNGESIDCRAEKRKAIKAWFSRQVLQLINTIQPYKQKARNVILSGGGAMDQILVEVLREEVSRLGFEFWPINELPKIETLTDSQRAVLSNPKFTCVEGLRTRAQLAFDNGNSTLKSKRGISYG